MASKTDWSRRYQRTVGCCFAKWHEMNHDQKLSQMMLDFHAIVVGDGVDPQAAHCEFLKIDDYRRRISPDIPGAEPDEEL